MSDAPAIYEALAAVMTHVQGVAKRDKNDHQKFMFRGIDAVMNAVGPALRAERVIVVPDVRDVTYADVTTSTGKAATACRVEVAYTFFAVDGSSITTSVAGEAWDSGDKACPKAMSVAFRTALLQALCLPTDEPDPDTHTYERSAVDMSQVEQAIARAQALGIEGQYDATREWAAESQANADAAASRLRKAIAAKELEDETAQEGNDGDGPSPDTEDAQPQGDPTRQSGGDGQPDEAPSPPDTPAWRSLAEAEGVTPEQIVIALQGSWPKNDDAARPARSKDLDAAAERHPEVVAKAIQRLGEEKRRKVAADA